MLDANIKTKKKKIETGFSNSIFFFQSRKKNIFGVTKVFAYGLNFRNNSPFSGGYITLKFSSGNFTLIKGDRSKPAVPGKDKAQVNHSRPPWSTPSNTAELEKAH